MTYWNQVVWEEIGWLRISKFRRKERVFHDQSVKIWNLYSPIEGCSEDRFNQSSIGLSIQGKFLKSSEKLTLMGVKIADTESHNTANVQNAQIVRLVLNSEGRHGPLLLPANSILYPFGIIPRLSITLISTLSLISHFFKIGTGMNLCSPSRKKKWYRIKSQWPIDL